jgi:hypothetical protein
MTDHTADAAPDESAATTTGTAAEAGAGPAAATLVVCDMTNAPDSAEQRLDEYARLFAAAFASKERTIDGVRWRLRADPGVEAWAQDLAARENACCAFMTNTISVAGGHVLWDATTTTIDDPSARAVLDLFFALPDARWTDVADVHERLALSGVSIVIVDGTVIRPATPEEIRSGAHLGPKTPHDRARGRQPAR